MTTITRSSLVMYTPDQMFDLVNDVEAYPSFLPWCRDSKIISKNDKVICATLDIAKGGIHHEFSTRNTLQHGESIRIELIDGPFRHLEGFWQFRLGIMKAAGYSWIWILNFPPVCWIWHWVRYSLRYPVH